MKVIGLLGGMSWESTALYYSWINKEINRKLGGLHSAEIVMVSIDFQELEILLKKEDWDNAGLILERAAGRLEAAGADFMLICTNTMHIAAPRLEKRFSIPLLHIADAAAKHVKMEKMKTVGLLGTIFTMEQDFYKERLAKKHGLNVIVPPEKERLIVNRIIFEELCHGIVKEESRRIFLEIMEQMKEQGAECIIEGCTEIVLLVQQEHTNIPLFDTTEIHAKEAAAMALL